MAYEAVGFDPSNNTLAPAVKAYLDSRYVEQVTRTFSNAIVGANYVPGTGTVYHDTASIVVSSLSSGAVTFNYTRTYQGILYMNQVVGDRNDSVYTVQPIIANMTNAPYNAFNGIAFNGAGIAAGFTFRLNYDVWGWA